MEEDNPSTSAAAAAQAAGQQLLHSAFSRVQPSTTPAKTLDIQSVIRGHGIERALPPSVPSLAAASRPPYAFQPFTDGQFPKPEPMMDYLSGFDMPPQPQQQQQPSLLQQQLQLAAQLVRLQQQQATAPLAAAPPPQPMLPAPTAAAEPSPATQDALNMIRAVLAQSSFGQQQQQQPQQLHPLPAPLTKIRAEMRGAYEDSGTESLSPTSAGSPNSMSRSNSFSVSSLLLARNTELFGLSPATSGSSLSGSTGSLASRATPPPGAAAPAAHTPLSAAAAPRFAPYDPPTPQQLQRQQPPPVFNPYGTPPQQQQNLQQLQPQLHQMQQQQPYGLPPEHAAALRQQHQQHMAVQAALAALNNPMGYPMPIHYYNLQREDCVVCEDRASGYHYGVLSCEGCKGFFRRSISKNEEYVCQRQFKDSCIINKGSRNRCQACRLAKCIKMGMSKDCVRADRKGNKRKVEAEEKQETRQRMMSQVAQYEPIIRQCEHAYIEAFPEGTFLMTREEALERVDCFISAVPLLAAGGRDAAEKALDRVVIVRAAFTADTCLALRPAEEPILRLKQVFTVVGPAQANAPPAPFLRHPLSTRIVALATAMEVVGAADIRTDHALESLNFALQHQLAAEKATPLYNKMSLLLGK